MSNRRIRSFFTGLILLGMYAGVVAYAAEEPQGEKGQKTKTLPKTTGLPRYQVLNISNLATWFRADGTGNYPPSGSGDGLYYPRGTGSADYENGLMWGAKPFRDAAKTRSAPFGQYFRVGGNEYPSGNQEGRIIGTGSAAVASNLNDADVRIYRIRRDYKVIPDDDVARDAAEYNEISISQVSATQKTDILTQYETDWKNWPTAYGAPHIERNGTPGYQYPGDFNYDPNKGALFTAESLITQNKDEPGLAGADKNIPADQVIWTVYNDLNESLVDRLYGCKPMGIETQVTLWGYKRTDALGNIYFKKFRFINKGGVDTSGTGQKGSFWLDSMYVAQWADIDLGNAGDDVVGCDTVLGMGFVYNGNAVDTEYRGFGLAPPVSGFDFLAGPIVAGVASDSGVVDLKRVYGKKNLPMTSFAFFSAGGAISDPRPRNWTTGAFRWYQMLKGFAAKGSVGSPDEFYPFPPGLTPGKFPFSGDPTKPHSNTTNYLDGTGPQFSPSPGDRRIILASGPFSLNPGDTNEVVVAGVLGIGADRLSSVSVGKFNDLFAQNTYNALFVVPSAPAPNARAALLDREVVLDWGWDPARYAATELSALNPGAFAFEGYNVYQMPNASAPLSAGKRIATYDLINAYAVLQDQGFDESSGLILTKPVQFGTNSGVTRTFDFKTDLLRDLPALNNGQDYYLAVTAYFRSTVGGYLPAVLESPPGRLTVRPQGPPPGARYNAKVGDALPAATHTAGTSEGSVTVGVVDPSRLTSDTYRLSFSGTATNKTYSITRLSTPPVTLFTGGRGLGANWGGTDKDFPTADGMIVYVNDALGVSNTLTAWSGGYQWLVGSGGDLFGGDPYAGFDEGILPGSEAGNHLGAMNPSFPLNSIYPIELRFDTSSVTNPQRKAYRLRRVTAAGNTYRVQSTNTYVNIPFSAWDVSNPASPRQLTVTWRDQNNNGGWNAAFGGTAVEFANIYNTSYVAAGGQFIVDADNDATGGPKADIVYMVDLAFKTATDSMSMNTGKLTINPKARFTSTDQYTFSPGSLAAQYNNTDLAKEDVSKINVFPNPYYAFNPQETSRFVRFVTFSHLPGNATIRIFNVAGHLIKTIKKEAAVNSTQFQRWDLLNQYDFPVASGIYIVHIDMPDLGTSKILKLAIIQEQEVLDAY